MADGNATPDTAPWAITAAILTPEDRGTSSTMAIMACDAAAVA